MSTRKIIVLKLTPRQAELCRRGLNFAADVRGRLDPRDKAYFGKQECRIMDRAASELRRQLLGVER
jgi:hypothetical protein